MRRLTLGALLVTLALAACSFGPSPTPRPQCPDFAPSRAQAAGIVEQGMTAQVRTNKGEFTITLEPSAAPIATANFVLLARCGFYDGITFHRVLSGFVIQAGDPQTKQNRGDFAGLGTGGPGYSFEIELPPENLSYDPYAVAMANSGQPNSNGSQFFIDLADLNGRLQRTYTIFGKVTAGQEVVDAIGALPVNDPRIGVPLDPAIIEGIEIRAPAEASPT